MLNKDGKRMTQKQRTLDVLIRAKRGERHYFWGRELPHGFVPLKDIVKAEVGGASAPRRIRDMREAGIDIQSRLIVIAVNGRPTKCYGYRLNTDTARIDAEACRLKRAAA